MIYKYFLLSGLLLLCACTNWPADQPQRVGSQHMKCERLFNLAGEQVTQLPTPPGFQYSPLDAIKIAAQNGGFNCAHKFGAQIYVDAGHYYLLRLGSGKTLDVHAAIFNIAAIVSGRDGSVWSMQYKAGPPIK